MVQVQLIQEQEVLMTSLPMMAKHGHAWAEIPSFLGYINPTQTSASTSP
jgi:hypothetical protein